MVGDVTGSSPVRGCMVSKAIYGKLDRIVQIKYNNTIKCKFLLYLQIYVVDIKIKLKKEGFIK